MPLQEGLHPNAPFRFQFEQRGCEPTQLRVNLALRHIGEGGGFGMFSVGLVECSTGGRFVGRVKRFRSGALALISMTG